MLEHLQPYLRSDDHRNHCTPKNILYLETYYYAPPHKITITLCDPYWSSEGAGADFRWYRLATRSVLAAAFRHGIGGK